MYIRYRPTVLEIIFCNKCLASVDERRLRKTRLRNRWYKAVTMVNNPSLILDRLQRHSRQESHCWAPKLDGELEPPQYTASSFQVFLFKPVCSSK
jgi:hypothetical protein